MKTPKEIIAYNLLTATTLFEFDSATGIRIFLFILKETLFKDLVSISISFKDMSQKTGIEKTSINRNVRNLVLQKVLNVKVGYNRTPSIFSINTDTGKWTNKKTNKSTSRFLDDNLMMDCLNLLKSIKGYQCDLQRDLNVIQSRAYKAPPKVTYEAIRSFVVFCKKIQKQERNRKALGRYIDFQIDNYKKG